MKVSVCLASYNGAAFLAAQLESILADLARDDEIILSDDASTDATIAIARGIGDPRIKIHAFRENVRHVRNFERALRLATGDLIFLADQDDIWVAGKRKRVVDAFAREPRVVMIVHALSLIDRYGATIAARSGVWAPRDAGCRPTLRYLARQVVKNQVTGCATAFRRELLDVLLPFPHAVYAHDHWLAVAAPFAGRVMFVDAPLVEYRQHEANVTPKNGLSSLRRVAVRAKLVALIAIAAARAARGRAAAHAAGSRA